MPRRSQNKRRTIPEASSGVPSLKRPRSSDITFEDLQTRLHLPLLEAALSLSISPTIFKRVARQLGVPRWPFRQMSWIANRVEDLEAQMNAASDRNTKAAIEEALQLLNRATEAIRREGVAPSGQVKTLTRALRNVFKNARVEVARTSSWEQTSNESESDADEVKLPTEESEDAAEISAFAESSFKSEADADKDELEENLDVLGDDPGDDSDFGLEDPSWAQIDEDEELFKDAASTLELVAMYIF